MYQLAKPVLFRMDPEKAHNLTLWGIEGKNPLNNLMKLAFKPLPESAMRPAVSKNMSWRHAIGIAAGFDKDARCLNFLEHIGFGAIEVGTVVKEPQVGNPKPRVWRMPEQKALRNALGFPSEGAAAVLPRVKAYKGKATLGVNIGKNKDTSLDEAPAEYFDLYKMFAPHADYITINVSSPNTADLRQLQERSWLEALLKPFTEIKERKPLYLKISPDESQDSVTAILEVAKEFELSGIIATNTTADHEFDKGGVSGDPIREKSIKVWSEILKQTDDSFDLVAVGGFRKTEHFEEYFDMGGKFCQVYTGLVYEGPSIVDLRD